MTYLVNPMNIELRLRILEQIPDDCRVHIKDMEKSWNGLQKIVAGTNEFREKVKESIAVLRNGFEIALNDTVSELFERGHVQSINRALMAIVMDKEIQNNCVNFPKSPKGLRNYLDEENNNRLLSTGRPSNQDRTMLENMSFTETEDGETRVIEQSSNLSTTTASYKDKTVTTDHQLFKAIGFNDIRPYNVWTFGKDSTMGLKHPGKIPTGLVYNTLYFLTKPGDLVVDPMAGGGVVGDCCYEVKRKCKMYDIKPTRKDIKKHNLTKGLPKEAHNADLIFWDPPYYKRIPTRYGPHSISALDRKDYLKFFGDFAQIAYESNAKQIALLITESINMHTSTVHTDTTDEEPIFLADYTKRFQNQNWRQVNRISCNIHPSAISSPEINEYREDKLIYGLARDLIIFQRS